jgi:hypothetical protein
MESAMKVSSKLHQVKVSSKKAPLSTRSSQGRAVVRLARIRIVGVRQLWARCNVTRTKYNVDTKRYNIVLHLSLPSRDRFVSPLSANFHPVKSIGLAKVKEANAKGPEITQHTF